MDCVLSTIIVLLTMDLFVCEPPGFAAYMGVDYQDGGFGKYIFMETKLHKPPRMKKPKLYTCRSSGMFPDPIDPGSYYKCTFSFSDGYTYSRYFCPPFYTYSEEKKSCVIYYDDPTGNGGNGTMIESIPVENITSIAEQPVGGIPAAGIPLATGTPAAGIPPAGSPLALASKPPAAASIPVASSSPVSAGIPGISTVAMPKT